jgi:hypothetical protein
MVAVASYHINSDPLFTYYSTTYLHLVPRLRMSGVIPPLLLYSFMAYRQNLVVVASENVSQPASSVRQSTVLDTMADISDRQDSGKLAGFLVSLLTVRVYNKPFNNRQKFLESRDNRRGGT